MKLSDMAFGVYSKDFKQKGFNNTNIIRNWSKVSLPRGVKNSDIFPVRISGKTLYLGTENLELYSEFTFYKKEVCEALVLFFGSDSFTEIKLTLIKK